MTRASWAKLGFYIFAAIFTAGVWWEFGTGWALMVGGLVGAVAMLTLVDVDGKVKT